MEHLRSKSFVFLLSLIVTTMQSMAQSKSAVKYEIPKTSIQDRCFLKLEVASKLAQEAGKNILAFIYPSRDPVIEGFLCGSSSNLLKELSDEFIFYGLDVSPGVLLSCSEKSFILEKMRILRLPTVLVIDPTTSRICKKIERPREGALTEQVLIERLKSIIDAPLEEVE